LAYLALQLREECLRDLPRPEVIQNVVSKYLSAVMLMEILLAHRPDRRGQFVGMLWILVQNKIKLRLVYCLVRPGQNVAHASDHLINRVRVDVMKIAALVTLGANGDRTVPSECRSFVPDVFDSPLADFAANQRFGKLARRSNAEYHQHNNSHRNLEHRSY